MGHRGEIIVAISGEAEATGMQNTVPAGTLPAGKLPAPFAAVLGLSLIFNVFVLWYLLLKKKSQKREVAHAH